jgi:hypothetical protein
MVEALIVLPVLCLLLVTLPLLHERYAARQQALVAARSCAFAHALGGCGETPEACSASPNGAGAPAPIAESDPTRIARDAVGDRFGVFDELPLIGDALRALLGDTTEARAAVALRRGSDPEQPKTIDAALALACNERPRDVMAIARAAFCERLPVIECGDSR